VRFTLLEELPPLRMLLIWDNLSGHHSAEMLCWLMAHGVMVLFTPLGGSWLNLAESIQRILVRRALSGTHPRARRRSSQGWRPWRARGTVILHPSSGAAAGRCAGTGLGSSAAGRKAVLPDPIRQAIARVEGRAGQVVQFAGMS
jgi:hypothetical protein